MVGIMCTIHNSFCHSIGLEFWLENYDFDMMNEHESCISKGVAI